MLRTALSRIGHVILWTLRLRFAILISVAPVVLGMLAVLYSHMLLALVLIRIDYPRWDMGIITWMSLLTAGLGIVIGQVIRLNGPARFFDLDTRLGGKAANVGGTPPAQATQAGWPWWLFAVWWALGLALPCICLWATIRDSGRPLASMLWGMFLGWLGANLTTVALAAIQKWALGNLDQHADAGILPYESAFESVKALPLFGLRTFAHTMVNWLFGRPDTGFAWLLRGPGYTDPETGVLLPGHAQLLITAFVSICVYLAWYAYDLMDSRWQTLGWPTMFFILLIVYLVGWFLSGVAFWCDRYAVPALLLVILYVAINYGVFGVDHFFQMDVGTTPAFAPKVATAIQEGHLLEKPDNLYTYAIGRRFERGQNSPFPPQLPLEAALESWKFPGDAGKHNRTLVVVTASGGGIQAAAWTAKVLTELDAKCPGLSQSIGVMSGVSGGSVGLMYYLGLRGVRDNNVIAFQPMLARGAAEDIYHQAALSVLEATAWGFSFPDLMRSILPPPIAPQCIDRGWALEAVWWNHMGHGLGDRQLMRLVSVRDLAPLVKEGKAPAAIFNATCVETGQRVLISPVRALTTTPSRAPAQTDPSRGLLVAKPIDFIDFPCENRPAAEQLAVDLPISTAVRLSASFSYVAPVAKPLPPCTSYYENFHFCDGGYADNSGLVTAVEAVQHLIECNKNLSPAERQFDRILILRIEAFPKDEAEAAKDNSGFYSAFVGPPTAMYATRISSQAERAELELNLLQDAHEPSPELVKQLAEISQQASTLGSALGVTSSAAAAQVQSLVGLPTSLTDLTQPGFVPDLSANALLLKNKLSDVKASLQRASTSKAVARDLIANLTSAEKLAADIPGLQSHIPIFSITFRFGDYYNPPPGGIDPPLSWSMSQRDLKAIEDAWADRTTAANWAKKSQNSKLLSADNLSPANLDQFFPSSK